jgi:hypothetical protein
MGEPSAIQDHPLDRFPRGESLLGIRCKTSVDEAHESEIVDDGGNKSQMISAFNTDRFHPRPSPAVCFVLRQRSQRKVNDFFAVCTCSMSVTAVSPRIPALKVPRPTRRMMANSSASVRWSGPSAINLSLGRSREGQVLIRSDFTIVLSQRPTSSERT